MTDLTQRDDRGMRTIAILLLAACTPRPTQADAPRYEQPRVIDAGAVVARPDAQTDTNSDEIRSVIYPEPAEPVDAAVEVAWIPPPVDAGAAFEYEDGIRIIRTKRRIWCVARGDTAGFCGETEDSCRKSWGARCTRRNSWACFKARLRTSGEDLTGCLESYSQCETMADHAASSAETTDVSACVIFRYDPKAKK